MIQISIPHLSYKRNYLIKAVLTLFTILYIQLSFAQVKWVNTNEAFGTLPTGFNVCKTNDSLDGKPFIAYYAIASLKNKNFHFTTDTTLKRRLTPLKFYEKNGQPLLVVNTTFFSFETNGSVNIVIKNGKLVAYNNHSIAGKGKDTLTYRHPYTGAIGITKKRVADIAWILTDSTQKNAYASQQAIKPFQDSIQYEPFNALIKGSTTSNKEPTSHFKKWKMHTAVGGGPVLVQNGLVSISNNEELKFSGKAINDQHPRTLMGYTKENQLIVMVIEGRNPGLAAGASLTQAAKLMMQLGCVEAINLDGGGSSCMLINGKETIRPSDKGTERAVPAVFIIQEKN